MQAKICRFYDLIIIKNQGYDLNFKNVTNNFKKCMRIYFKKLVRFKIPNKYYHLNMHAMLERKLSICPQNESRKRLKRKIL